MGLIHQQVNTAYSGLEKKNLAANTTIGFALTWAMDSAESAANLLVFDPLRLGQGTGSASAGGSKWGVLLDLGRATAFLPLGKLVRLGAAVRTEVQAGSRVAYAVAADGSSGGAAARAAYGVEIDRSAQPLLDGLGSLFRAPDPGGPICWAISLVRALQSTGRYFITLEDLSRVVLGNTRTLAHLDAELVYKIERLVSYLRSMRVPAEALSVDSIKVLRVENRLAEACKVCSRLTGGKGGTLVFGVEWKLPNGAGAAHALCARLVNGTLQIYDRTNTVVTSLRDLERFYPGIGSARFRAGDSFVFIPEARLLTPAATALHAAPFTAGSMLGPLAVPVKVIPSLLMPR